MLRTRNRESVTAIVARPLLESCDELPPDSMLPLALISNERGDVCGALVGVQRDELRAAGGADGSTIVGLGNERDSRRCPSGYRHATEWSSA